MPFKPGQSGNPGGRPKGIAAIARQHTDKAIEVLAAALDDKEARVRISAASELLDRGWGKPLQMTADMTNKLDELTDSDLDSAIAFLKSAIDAAGDDRAGAGKATKH